MTSILIPIVSIRRIEFALLFVFVTIGFFSLEANIPYVLSQAVMQDINATSNLSINLSPINKTDVIKNGGNLFLYIEIVCPSDDECYGCTEELCYPIGPRPN
jgi:hypothetical protein